MQSEGSRNGKPSDFAESFRKALGRNGRFGRVVRRDQGRSRMRRAMEVLR